MSFYFLVAFNLNKGASTSISASSKTRWEKNSRATFPVAKHLNDNGVCVGRKVYLVLKYLESRISSCCVIQQGILGDFMVSFVLKMNQWEYLKGVLWRALLNSLWFVADAHKVTGSYRFLWEDSVMWKGGEGIQPKHLKSSSSIWMSFSPICLQWMNIMTCSFWFLKGLIALSNWRWFSDHRLRSWIHLM